MREERKQNKADKKASICAEANQQRQAGELSDRASELDRKYMAEVLKLAEAAARLGEVPIAAIIVEDGKILAAAANSREAKANPLGHAEVLAILEAAEKTKRRFFPKASLYCNLEPCLMCLGAVIQARLGRIVYAADDPKGGAIRLLESKDLKLNHRPQVIASVLAAESAALLKAFFKDQRQQNKELGSRAQRRRLYESGQRKIDLKNTAEVFRKKPQHEEE